MDGMRPIADFGFRISDSMGGSVKAEGLGEGSTEFAGSHRQAALDDATPSSLQSNPVDRSDEQKKQIAKDFESVLLTKLFDQVQESMGHWELEEDGTSQQVQGLFWFYLARDAADKGGFGLWKDIYQHLQQMGGAPNPADVLNEEL